MSTIIENLDTIKTNISRMKSALGVSPNTPLEQVTQAVEQGGGGSTGIHKVASIEERDALQANEGDLCVIYTNEIGNYSVGDSITSLCFPEEIVVETAIARSYSARFMDRATYEGLMIELNATRLRVRDMETYEILVQYTSSDGITYIKEAAYANVTEYTASAPLPPEMGATETIYQFLFTQTLAFGCYSYLENAWNYTDIGCSVSEDLMFKPGKAYSNTGIKEGTLNKDLWRNNFMYFQNEEPVEKKGIWCTLNTSQLYSASTYSKKTETTITEENVMNPANTFNLVRASAFRVVKGTSVADLYYTCNGVDVIADMDIYYNGSSTSSDVYGILTEGKLYGLDRVNGKMYLYDFINNTRTIKTTPPSGIKTCPVQDVAFNNNKIYYATCEGSTSSSSYNATKIFVYDITANTWSTYNLGNPGSDYGTISNIVLTDNHMICFHSSKADARIYYLRRYALSDFSFVNELVFNTEEDLGMETTSSYTTIANNFLYTFRIFRDCSYYSNGDTMYSPYHSIDLSTFTKESIMNQISQEGYNPVKSPAQYREEKEYYYWYPYQRCYLGKKHITTEKDEVILYGVSDGTKIQCTYDFMFAVGDTIYAFESANTNLYSININNATIVPTYNPVLQVGKNGKEVEISEGLTLNLENVCAYNYNGVTMNNIKQIYIGDGESWTLFKDYTL